MLSTVSTLGFAQTHAPEERFAGIHFDFHAKETDTGIGRSYTMAMADSFLQIVKPEFIQIDCKGHPGYSSYPSSVGNAAPDIRNDLMKLWSIATKQNNVCLYAHYSGLLDERALKQNPSWAITDADSSKENIISPSSNYSDALMIPQLKELAGKYKIDGAWIDGDCWAVKIDYAQPVINAFAAKYPNTKIPLKQGDDHYADWIALNREAYKKYFAHYVDALHQYNPDFKIINNWAFSAYMPEKTDVNVDFLSGDIRGITPYEAAFEGRCMAAKNKLWDIMTWSQINRNNKMTVKSYSQMAQEAANIIALGGGFETYWQQNRDGSLPTAYFKKMADVIDFCKQRKEYVFNGKIVPQVGLLFSDEIWKNMLISDHLYAETGLGYFKQVFKILSDAQYSTDVLMYYDLDQRLATYPAVVIPLWSHLSSDVIQSLLKYVNNGGNLLIIGANAVKPFATICNITLNGNAVRNTNIRLSADSSITVNTDMQPATINSIDAEAIGNITNGASAKYPAATIHKIGKGKIGLIYFDPKNLYGDDHVEMIKYFIADVLAKMYINPVVTIKNAPLVEQVITTKNNHLFIHLINMGGSNYAYDSIPKIPAFNIEVKRSLKPSTVVLQPGKIKLAYSYENGILDIEIPRLDIYSIVQVD